MAKKKPKRSRSRRSQGHPAREYARRQTSRRVNAVTRFRDMCAEDEQLQQDMWETISDEELRSDDSAVPSTADIETADDVRQRLHAESPLTASKPARDAHHHPVASDTEHGSQPGIAESSVDEPPPGLDEDSAQAMSEMLEIEFFYKRVWVETMLAATEEAVEFEVNWNDVHDRIADRDPHESMAALRASPEMPMPSFVLAMKGPQLIVCDGDDEDALSVEVHALAAAQDETDSWWLFSWGTIDPEDDTPVPLAPIVLASERYASPVLPGALVVRDPHRVRVADGMLGYHQACALAAVSPMLNIMELVQSAVRDERAQ